jgi:hypothetical protein
MIFIVAGLHLHKGVEFGQLWVVEYNILSCLIFKLNMKKIASRMQLAECLPIPDMAASVRSGPL